MAGKTLTDQMAAERKLYLGKLGPDEKVPGSDKTVAELREDYRKANDAHEASIAARQTEFDNSNKRVVPDRVSVVTHDTVVNLSPGKGEVVEKADPVKRHTQAALKAMTKAEVVTIATGLKLTVVPDSSTEDEIITKILESQKSE